MDLMKWYADALALKQEIKGMRSVLDLLDAQIRSAEETLSAYIKNRDPAAVPGSAPPDRVGQAVDK
jgi:hypothetical protein